MDKPPAWVGLLIGLGVIASLLTVAYVMQTKFDKAAVYVCYYGAVDPSTAIFPNHNDPHFINFSSSINDMRCYQATQDDFSCPFWYDKTVFQGYIYVTKEDVIEANRRSSSAVAS